MDEWCNNVDEWIWDTMMSKRSQKRSKWFHSYRQSNSILGKKKNMEQWLPLVTVAQTVKRLPIMQETRVRSLGQKETLEKEMATHSSTLAWKIPRMEEPGRQQSMGLQRVRHDWVTSLHFTGNWEDIRGNFIGRWKCLISWQGFGLHSCIFFFLAKSHQIM